MCGKIRKRKGGEEGAKEGRGREYTRPRVFEIPDDAEEKWRDGDRDRDREPGEGRRERWGGELRLTGSE